jgi:hypothetical protein
MKFLMSSILVFSVMCSVFAAEFNFTSCSKLFTAKNYAGVVEYLKTNKECKDFRAKSTYIGMLLVEPGFIQKSITAANFEAAADKAIANSGFTFSNEEKIAIKASTFANAQYANVKRPDIKDKFMEYYLANASVLDIFAKQEDYLARHLAVMFYIGNNKDYKRAFEYSITNTTNKSDARIYISVESAKKLGPEYIAQLCQIVTKNPAKRIYTAVQLNQIVELSKRLAESKYDTTVKALYIALKRSFYQNIVKGDDWKAAVTNLQLQMNAYSM